jgi:hypothetical protein
LKTVHHLREDWIFLLEALFQIGQTLAKLVVIGHIIILKSLSAPAVIVRTIFIQDSRLCLHVENEPPHLFNIRISGFIQFSATTIRQNISFSGTAPDPS